MERGCAGRGVRGEFVKDLVLLQFGVKTQRRVQCREFCRRTFSSQRPAGPVARPYAAPPRL